MKDEALALVRGLSDPGECLNRLREYLQAIVLRSFHECEAFRPLAFVGGTALRFLHNLQAVLDDVTPFLERPKDAALLTRENLENLLHNG